MSNDKQSSVEWFAKESWKLRVELEDEKISLGEYANKYYQLKEQAKAMHKDEIESTYDDAIMKGRHKDGVEYYKEKFGGDKWKLQLNIKKRKSWLMM